jgi:glyoxylase-like metal-dependent hydrolase (beta-lactamase superfamily II)
VIQEITIGPITQFKMARRVLGYDLYYTAAYLVDGLLIDTGFQHVANEFFEHLRQRHVQQIVHTHAHEDHIGADYLFQKHLGLRAKAHPAAIELICHPPKKLRTYRKVVWGLPNAAKTEPVENEISTDNYTFKVIYLPGHSEDHVGLYEPNEGWFFGGDLFLGVKVRVLRNDEKIHDLMDSLRKAAKLPMSKFFCSSSKILDSPMHYLEKKLQFFEDVKGNVLELHRQGMAIKQIRDKVLGHEQTITYISQGEFSKLNLVKGILNQNG